MAKKLNKKVVVIGIAVLSLIVIGTAALAIRHLSQRDPERNLEIARQALTEGDYQRAERFFGRAFAYGKSDAWKIERLFEMADFHLIHNERHEANWPKALSCWNTVLNIDPKNVPARQNMMQYYYELADSGSWAVWKNVHDEASKLIELAAEKNGRADTKLQQAFGRAALSIAQRGGTSNRTEYLTQAIQSFETLIEREPATASHYNYLAEAFLVQGELNAQAGFINARPQAQQKAMDILDQAVQVADDKAAALAARYSRELLTAGSDPEKIETLRAELEAHVKSLEPNPKLLLTLSQAYEIPGSASAEAELNRAIEAARQAARLAPDEFDYSYRLAMLLYRKGSAFADTAAMDDAVTFVEEMKTQPAFQVIPGPRYARNLAFRNALNMFLARYYLEQAIDNTDDAGPWIAKAEPLIDQIAQYYGSSEHMAVQQWEGTLALAKGERDKAIRLLHRAYEQAKALDIADQPSTIDPTLCMMLARVAHEENLLGLRREFLEKAMSNRNRIILDRPGLILDYADMMAQFQAWNRTVAFAQAYQQRYGADARSQKLLIDAALALSEFDQVTEAIDALPEQSPERKALRIRLLTAKIAQAARLAGQDTTGQAQSPAALQAEQQTLLLELIDAAPDKCDVQILRDTCIYYLQRGQKDPAVALLDAYLARRPNTPTLNLLRLQADEPDPLAIPTERNAVLRLKAADTITDPKERAMAKAAVYRSIGEYDNALKMLADAAAADNANDADVIEERFNIALERNDVNGAEDLWRIMRTRNLDGTEGNTAAAQIEMLKKNYTLALRRADEALAIKPLSSMAHYLKSRINQELGNIDTAIENSRQATHMAPLNSLYSKNHASILFSRNSALGTRATLEQQNELQQSLTRAMYLNPNDWQLQSVYAEIVSTQSPDRALALRRQILQNHPTPANAVMLGNMALRMAKEERDVAKKTGLLDLSGKAFTQALTLDPDNDAAKTAYADFLRQTNQSELAEQLLSDDKNLLWRYYLQNAQYEEAQQLLNELHQADPEDINVLRGLVLVAEGAGNRTDVKRVLDRLAAVDNNKDGQLWIIQKYLDTGYIDDANKKLASVKERYPEEKLILLMEAWSRMTNGRLSDALTLTNRYLEANADNAGAWRLRGRIYRLMNEPRRAVDDLQRSKSLTPNPAVSMELAAVYSELQQIDAAIGELVSGLGAAQVPLQMRLMLESLYQTHNRLADLERFYAQTIQQFPNAPFWPMRAGQFYLSRSEPARAMPYLKQAWDTMRRQNAADPTAVNLYLDALTQNRLYNEVYTAGAELIDGHLAPIAYTRMAEAYFRQGQRDRAETFFMTALDKSGAVDSFQELALSTMLNTVGQEPAVRWTQKNPNALPSLLLSYRIALHNEQFNRGIEALDKGLALVDPQTPEWGSLSLKKANVFVQAYMKTADKSYMDRAINLFEQIVTFYPNSPSVLNNLAYLLAVNDEKPEEAIQYARRAHQQDPSNPTYLDTYAYAQYKLGQAEQARQNLLRAVHLYDVNRQPIPWEVYNHLGLVHQALGETAYAIENFRKALTADTNLPEQERTKINDRINTLKQQTNTSI